MPYEIKMQDGKHCVFNKDTGDNKGCSDTHGDAVAHMRALYAAENAVTKNALPQSNVNYNAVGGDGTKACANCQFFWSPDMCNIVGGTISPTGICDMWHEEVAPDPMPVEVTNMQDMPMATMKSTGCECLSCTADDDEGPFQIKAAMTRASINDLPDSAFAYIEPGCDTKSCRHFPIHDAAHVRNALARLSQSPFGAKASAKVHAAAKKFGIQIAGDTKKSFFDKLFSALRANSLHPPVSDDFSYASSGSPLVLTKSTDGRLRVLMRVSNIFKDRHGEIITTEAHKDYVNWVYAGQDRMPEFWLWHIKGSRWGQADFVDFSDGFITLSGLVDPGYEHIAESLAQMGKSLGVSHGFYGLSLTNKGFIDLYRDFEASPLPLKHAANIWTALSLTKEAGLPLSEDRRNFLIKDLRVPETVVDEWGKTNKELHDILKENNVAWKDSDPIPSESTNVDAPATEQSGPTLADVMAKLTSMSEELTTVKAAQKALESKTDDAVASALEAAIVSGKGFVPSQSKENTPTQEAAQTVEDNWWEEVVMKPALNRS